MINDSWFVVTSTVCYHFWSTKFCAERSGDSSKAQWITFILREPYGHRLAGLAAHWHRGQRPIWGSLSPGRVCSALVYRPAKSTNRSGVVRDRRVVDQMLRDRSPIGLVCPKQYLPS